MSIFNYINLRWKNGYDFFSDAPININNLVKDYAEQLDSMKGPVIHFTYDRKYTAHVLLLTACTYNTTIQREVSYMHSIVVFDEKEHYLTQNLAVTFLKVYGKDVQSKIEILCNSVSSIQKNDYGRGVLRKYFISEEDLRNIHKFEKLSHSVVLEKISKNKNKEFFGKNLLVSECTIYLSNIWSLFNKTFSRFKPLIKGIFLLFIVLFLSVIIRNTIANDTLSNKTHPVNKKEESGFRRLYQDCLEGKSEKRKYDIQHVKTTAYSVKLYCENKKVLVSIYRKSDVKVENIFATEVILKQRKSSITSDHNTESHMLELYERK